MNLTTIMKIGLIFLVLIGLIPVTHAQGEGLTELVSELMGNTNTLIAFIIQFILGLSLGYYSTKVIKHIIALIGIVIIGILLNVWQLGGVEEFVTRTGLEWSKVYPLLQSIIAAFGILTILPIGLGFFIGVIIATRR